MKNLSHLKKIFLLTLIIWVVEISLSSCKNEQKPKDSGKVAEEQTESTGDATREREERFLMKAAEFNLGEIQLSLLAQQKGTMAEVKELGKMMETDHTKIRTGLKALADQKSIAIPSEPTSNIQNLYQKLSEKSGNDFDMAYCGWIVMKHKEAIFQFANAAKQFSDPDIVAWANAMDPELRKHLIQAEACMEKAKN